MADEDRALLNPLEQRLTNVEEVMARLELAFQHLEGRLVGLQQALLESERFIAKQHLDHFSLWAQYHLFTQLQGAPEQETADRIQECVRYIRETVAEYDHQVWHSTRPLPDAEECTDRCRQFCAQRQVSLAV